MPPPRQRRPCCAARTGGALRAARTGGTEIAARTNGVFACYLQFQPVVLSPPAMPPVWVACPLSSSLGVLEHAMRSAE